MTLSVSRGAPWTEQRTRALALGRGCKDKWRSCNQMEKAVEEMEAEGSEVKKNPPSGSAVPSLRPSLQA